MASATDNSFSHTLLSITTAKLEQLAKKRDTFERQYAKVNATFKSEEDELEKVKVLSEGLKTSFAVPLSGEREVIRGSTKNPRMEIDLKNFDRFLAQARYDPSISETAVKQWQEALSRHLEVQSLKYSYADLYGRLTTEWLSSKQRVIPSGPKDDVDMDDFEHVSGAKRADSRRKWEQSVFEPANVTQENILIMLRAIFDRSDDESKPLREALEALRKHIKAFETQIATGTPFTDESLKWTMSGLISSDLLTEEKRNVLRGFLENSVVLGEIADVLNMRIGALDEWSWGDVVHLEERRQLNGDFSIYMHEDLLQAIFLQFIGVEWSVAWKAGLREFPRSQDVWKSPQDSMTKSNKRRRAYFLGPEYVRSSVASKERWLYRKQFFAYQLYDSEKQSFETDQGAEEANFEDMYVQPQMPPSGRTKQTARVSTRGMAPRKKMSQQNANPSPMQQMAMQQAAPHRQLASKAARIAPGSARDWPLADEDDDEDDEEDDTETKNPMEAKQGLLHLFSTSILFNTRLHGEIACFRSQINALFSSLPHVTILTVLAYLGVSKKWVSFFRKFLEAPLQFIDDQSTAPRKRKRGTPGSHVLSEVFSEVVLFCLDFQINLSTKSNLWRMGDDFWFWSRKHETCRTAWRVITKFMDTTGLSLNEYRTGSAYMVKEKGENDKLYSADVGDDLPEGQIRWGMLYLNPESGLFEIDQQMVDKHIDEMSRQLDGKKDSIFAWIQGWNSYATTFFTTNFGRPANCFGRQHVEKMLATHERIQRKIFTSANAMNPSTESNGGGSVVEYLRQSIEQRFGVTDIPDGYFFFPSVLGGLEIQSPFVSLLQMREATAKDPGKLLADFLQEEKDSYQKAKARYESGELAETHDYMNDPNWVHKPHDSAHFFSFEEYTKFREVADDELGRVFQELLEASVGQNIEGPDNHGPVVNALSALSGQSNLRGIKANWYEMDSYWKWVTQLYGPEMIQRFGGLRIVDPGLLPTGMVSLLRSARLDWQE